MRGFYNSLSGGRNTNMALSENADSMAKVGAGASHGRKSEAID